MNNLLKLTTSILLMICINTSVSAQHYDNFYGASNADLLQLQGTSRIEHLLKGATVIFPNGSNHLDVLINIPYSDVDNKPNTDSGFSSPKFFFNLKINIDPIQIQEELPSSKTFVTHGLLTLNNITKSVTVQYVPAVSGTEENGNFNIYMAIQFNAADFNLAVASSNLQYIIKINNAVVNRV